MLGRDSQRRGMPHGSGPSRRESRQQETEDKTDPGGSRLGLGIELDMATSNGLDEARLGYEDTASRIG